MKKLIFLNNELWIKFWYWLSYFNKKILYNILKIKLFLKKFYIFFIFKILYNIFLLKLLINNTLELKKNINITNYLQKGYKSKNLGIYIRNFLKKKDNLNILNKYCYLIMRFKRKNLFLTLLNKDGNVACKTNIGSCGFKKKVKYTGFAIKRTSRSFSKKILGSFIKTISFNRKICNKKLYKIKELIFSIKKNNIKKYLLKKQTKRKKIKAIIKNKRHNINWNKKIIYNKKIIRDKIIKNKIIKKFSNYRNYSYFSKEIKNNFKIKIRIKSNLKFWGYRFVMYGLAKKFRWFNGLEIRLPKPHSKGLRLKKKRRI